jgi:orotidine-5'-phosphate decarboxylase
VNVTARERLILALDLPTWREAEGVIERLQGKISLFKVGLELFTREGPHVIERIRQRGGRVFLDLKLHDIPRTVAAAAAAAVEWGVFMLDLHVAGGQAMMQAAAAAVGERAGRLGVERPRLLGVTVLTSLTKEDLLSLGVQPPVEDQVLQMATAAKSAGLDGVVTSPLEAAHIRTHLGPNFLIVTPGIRSSGTSSDVDGEFSRTEDQRRTLPPREALQAGADYLVIGRPILRAKDPVQAVEALILAMHPSSL